MFNHVRSLLLFALYQCCLFAGILLMPVAVLASRVGVRFPYHRVVARVGGAYDRAKNH
ncbi:hypothetical protein [Halomarina rubra]|uniref:1-acyl-sn-glycerol-3-phosphate acyltransferase n=1 Tax=Halomarina rubra TaxID=2071873 RepID=A0ABD6AZK9_9EURY|nr:hypothetical protein [Halomarina rubra]